MHLHRWSKWVDGIKINTYWESDTMPSKTQLQQERRCTLCNKVRTRRVTL